MSRDEIQRMLDSMEPLEASDLLANSARRLFSVLDDEERQSFLVNLVESADQGSEAGLVHF